MYDQIQKFSWMKLSKGLTGFLGLALLASNCSGAGLLKPVNSSAQDSVTIKSQKVSVTINNGFARTEVDQIFANTGEVDLEAIYSHPLPKQSSLSEVSLWVDGQEIIGEVLERERVAQEYQRQKDSGNTVAKAEKNDFMTFEVSVHPVKANQTTRVRLVYYQPIEIDANVGRYLYPLEEGGTDDEKIQFWSTDTTVQENFSFNLLLKSAFPVTDVRLPGNMDKAVITTPGSANGEDPNSTQTSEQYEYTVKLENNGKSNLSNDIVFYYKLADNVPARIEVIPYRKDKKSDGTLMAIITPAADLQLITEGTDWVFILDKSGSMSGGKIQTLTKGVAKVLGDFKQNDRYRIITFSDNAQDITSGYKQATSQNLSESIATINNITANGSTNLYGALELGYKNIDADRTTNVVLVTDGVANVGETGHKAFIKLLQQYDLRLFTFIIGNSANQPLMERLAEVSGGFAMNISNNDDIAGRILQAKTKALYQNMHDVTLKFNGEKVYDLSPAKPTSLYRGQQLVVFGKYKGSGPVELVLNAKISGEEKSWKCNAFLPEQDTDNPELERMWALSHIDGYMQEIRDFGENETLRGKIVNLGEEYSLVTDYTSMLVLTEAEFEKQGITRRNADRVNTERTAQQQKASQPVKNYRVDNNTDNGNSKNGAFDNRPAPSFHIGGGGGPVGPALLALIFWNKRIQKNRKNKINKP